MTREDIVALSREADLHAFGKEALEAVERFAKLVAEREREECAKTCEKLEEHYAHTFAHLQCAAAIRARSAA